MGALYGEIFGDWRTPVQADQFALRAAALKHRARGGMTRRISAGAALAWANAGTPSDALLEGQPWVDRDLWIALDGRIHNHAALCKELQLPVQTRVFALLVAVWRRWGINLAARLEGDFALAIVDFVARKLVLMRDPLGARALHYRLVAPSSQLPARLCFASEESALVDAATKPCERALADYFAFATRAATQTMFAEVQTLAAGSMAWFSKDRVEIARSEFVMPAAVKSISVVDALAQYRSLLQDALTRHRPSDATLAISLSGGLDSNALFAMAAEQRPEQIVALSWRFGPDLGCDESELAAAHAKARSVSAQSFDAEKLALFCASSLRPVSLNTPRANPYRELKTALYALSAKCGAKTLFNGAFGDHLFFDDAEWLVDSLKRGDYSELASELYWRLRQTPKFWREPSLRRLLRRMLQLPVYRTHDREWLTPFARSNVSETQPIKGFRGHQFELTLGAHAQFSASGEAEFAERFGIDVKTPYRTPALMRFMLSLPVHLMHRRGSSKWLVREAMRAHMPEVIRTRVKSSSLQPFLDHALAGSARVAAQSLLFGKGADWQRFYLQAKIEALFNAQSRSDKETALLWTCLAYEQWRIARGMRD